LAVWGNDLYAGGQFTMAGGSNASHIAKWNGNSWTNLSLGITGGTSPSVSALTVADSQLYVAGNFRTAGGSNANYIAKWDGSVWTTLGLGVNNAVYAMAVSGTNLYAGGRFTIATKTGVAPLTVNRIAKWDGSTWSTLGSGM